MHIVFAASKRRCLRMQRCRKNVCDGCSHCGKCLEACPFGAIYKDEQFGLILTDRDKCRKCRKCQEVCPNDAIRFDADGRWKNATDALIGLRKAESCMRKSVPCKGHTMAVIKKKDRIMEKEIAGYILARRR